MRFPRLTTFIAGSLLTFAGMVTLRGPESVTEATRNSISANTSGTTPSPIQREGQRSNNPGTRPRLESGFGSLLVAAKYRVTNTGCNPEELRFIKAESAGPSPDFLPAATECTSFYIEGGPIGVYGFRYAWQSEATFQPSWSGLLHGFSYVSETGSLTLEPVQSIVDRLTVECYASLSLADQFKIICRLDQQFNPASGALRTPQELIELAVDAGLTSRPIYIYQAADPFK